MHGDFPRLGEDERGLIIGNHPSDLQLWTWLDVVTREFSPDVLAVMKKEFLYDPRILPPILGWPAYLGKMGVPIDRSNRISAVRSIRRGCKDIFTPGKAMILLAEGHRPTKKRIAEAVEKGATNRPDLKLNEWLHHTPFPRSGGLRTVLQALNDQPLRILNTTVSSDVDEEGESVLGATIHVHGEEVTREEILGVDDWLLEEWKRKNQLIAEWKAA